MHNAEEIVVMLSVKYCKPEWAFIPQVRSGTGYSSQVRTADALALSLWPSRGIELHGFEIKVNRTDWMRELKNPAKAEEIAKYCDYWWVVAPKEIVPKHEVPANWGLLCPSGRGLRLIKPTSKLKSKPLSKVFLAAILRKAQEVSLPTLMLKKEYDLGWKAREASFDNQMKYERQDHDRLKAAVSDFKKASGVEIYDWTGGEIGDAVKRVMDGEHTRIREELLGLQVQSDRINEDIKKALQKEEVIKQ